MENYTDQFKKDFLLSMVKECYPQGDNFHAHRTKKGMWIFGYSNDYPLQHGNGIDCRIPDKLLESFMNKLPKERRTLHEVSEHLGEQIDKMESLINPAVSAS